MIEQIRHGLPIMRTPDRLSQSWRNVNAHQLRRTLVLPLQRHRISDHKPAQGLTRVHVLDSISGKDPVRADAQDFSSAVAFEGLGGLDHGAESVGHVIDQDGDLFCRMN